MKNTPIVRIKSIADFHRSKGLPAPVHPLISVIDYGTIECAEQISAHTMVLDFYNISLKRGMNAKMKYGQQSYDFDEGVLFFLSPNQLFGIEPHHDQTVKRRGWMLLIHPDFLWNTPLAQNLKKCEFFDYATNEALFLSEKEEATLKSIINHIQEECVANIDKFSQSIIISHIETLLNYSERFYQRQFITRQKSNHQLLSRLEKLLEDYFANEELVSQGIPSVQYIAEQLHVSSSYLGGVLKTLTGQSTQQHIHEKLIEKAKEKLAITSLSVSEIAFQLGFEHSQSFSKLFKSKVEMSPLEFRASFN